MDERAIREQADELRELARQRDEALRAERASRQAAEDEFRAGVVRFGAEAVRRLTGAGVPPVEALLQPPAVYDGPRWRSWQRPTLRQRVAAWRERPAAPPAAPAVRPVSAGWQLPFIDPVTGARRDSGQPYTVVTYEQGAVSSRAPGRLIVFLGTDGVLRFAASPAGAIRPYLYPYADDAWLSRFAGKQIATLPRAEVVAGLGLTRSALPEHAAEDGHHHAALADGILVGWYAALEDLLAATC